MKASLFRGCSTALFALACACQSPAVPTAPSYAGEWSGTTAQGKPITFTISPDEVVTTITIGHDFNGCAGSETFSNLSLKTAPNVVCIPGPCPASVTSYRGFGYGTGNPLEGPATDVNALLLSTTRAEGTVNFRIFPGCGSAIGVAWSAIRR